jgi:putative Mn2+ efflux pump MntP
MLGTVFFFGVLAGVDKLQACSAIGLLPIRRIVVGEPLPLSFDNLLAGAGISSLHYPVVIPALTIGLVSALISFIGLYLGASIRRFVPGRMDFAVGACSRRTRVINGRSLSMQSLAKARPSIQLSFVRAF